MVSLPLEYFSLNVRLTFSSLVSAFVGAATAREIVATEVKDGEDDEEGGEELPLVVEKGGDVEPQWVGCFVGCRELRDSGQQKRSW